MAQLVQYVTFPLQYLRACARGVGPHKMLCYFEAHVHESIIFDCSLPTRIAHAIALLSHDYCAIHDPPTDPPFMCHTPYNIGHGNIV